MKYFISLVVFESFEVFSSSALIRLQSKTKSETFCWKLGETKWFNHFKTARLVIFSSGNKSQLTFIVLFLADIERSSSKLKSIVNFKKCLNVVSEIFVDSIWLEEWHLRYNLFDLGVENKSWLTFLTWNNKREVFCVKSQVNCVN